MQLSPLQNQGHTPLVNIFKSSLNRVPVAEWLSSHKIVGLSPAEATWLIKNRPTWATGDDNGASFHSAVNEYLGNGIDRDGSCTKITCGALSM